MKATSVILGANRVDQLDTTLAVVQFVMSANLKKCRDGVSVEVRRGDAARSRWRNQWSN
jgi:hypothetical protein